MRHHLIILHILVGLGIWSAPAAIAAERQHIIIGGTGSALGAMKRLAQAYRVANPHTQFNVLPSLGSGGGIDALLDGAIDLAVSARPPKKREAGAHARIFARTPVVLAGAPQSSELALTTSQLEDIYHGRKTTWSSGISVRLVLRPKLETASKLLANFSSGMKGALQAAYERDGLLIATNDQKNAVLLEKLAGSLGTITLGQIKTEYRNLNVVSIDSQTPGHKSTAIEDYPHTKSLYFVTRGQVPAKVKSFLAFVYGQEGQSFLSAHGFVPEQPASTPHN